ncbi:FMN-dependent dehydrogenase [Gracilaria domingensis]|nr:FMN-dependent dehydrogenase [Gracilaria domingensis]
MAPTTTPTELEPRPAAAHLLPRPVYDYFAGAAADEYTYRANLLAFRCWLFAPRFLRAVDSIRTTATVPPLPPLSSPLLVAPMAMQCMAHPDGELAVARAVQAEQLAYIASTFATTSLERIASTAVPRVFQLYCFSDRSITNSLIRRAAKESYSAVVITVDAPVFGRRVRDENNSFRLPSHLSFANFDHINPENGSNTMQVLSEQVDQRLTFDVLRQLVAQSPLPIWVKGILRADDALAAIEAGASAIVVSNHGGRQLDGSLPSLQALPSIAKAVSGRVPVLFDSGIRCGEHVVKAIALGASAVLLGRPVLWALADGGEDGVRSYLRDMKQQVELTMKLAGATCIEEITPDLLVENGLSKL